MDTQKLQGYLLNASADVNIKDNEELTALNHAEIEGHLDIVNLLKANSTPIQRFKNKNANLIKTLVITTMTGVCYQLWQNFQNK